MMLSDEVDLSISIKIDTWIFWDKYIFLGSKFELQIQSKWNSLETNRAMNDFLLLQKLIFFS